VWLLRSPRVHEEQYRVLGDYLPDFVPDGRGVYRRLEPSDREGMVRHDGLRSLRRDECTVPNMATHSVDGNMDAGRSAPDSFHRYGAPRTAKE